VYTHVREDQLCLFGFLTHLERDVFEILLGASGVGPKVAIAILSALEAIQVLEAVRTENKGRFAGISGVGKKTIEKLFVEIREKCEKRLLLEKGSLGSGAQRGSSGVRLAVDNAPWANDLEQALVALGYKDNDLRAVLRETMKHSGELPVFEMALKFALKLLNAGGSKMVRGTA
jgi:Holliday junction DNA helicase RuvA